MKNHLLHSFSLITFCTFLGLFGTMLIVESNALEQTKKISSVDEPTPPQSKPACNKSPIKQVTLATDSSSQKLPLPPQILSPKPNQHHLPGKVPTLPGLIIATPNRGAA